MPLCSGAPTRAFDTTLEYEVLGAFDCGVDIFQDLDGDGRGATDNCPFTANVSQSDSDVDFEGDHCDLDDGTIYLTFAERDFIDWQEEAGFDAWNLYRGDLALLPPFGYTQVHNGIAGRFCDLALSFTADPFVPHEGAVAFYLVTGETDGVESGLGLMSGGLPRHSAHPCL